MDIISKTFQTLSVGEQSTHQNLGMIPLIMQAGSEPDYIILDEALEAGTAQIREVSESGNVPELLFDNKGDNAILVLDGEELVGAKQNRILNLTILVAAKTSIIVPVSCVEAGRWSHTSQNFHSEQRSFYAAGRAKKAAHVTESLQRCGSRHSRQGEVWDDIAMKSSRLNSQSSTDAMASMYVKHTEKLEEFSMALQPIEQQCGAIFSINGVICGLELFDFSQTFQKVSGKLIRSYALDAIDQQEPVYTKSDLLDVNRFITAIEKANTESFEAIGEGDDIRITHHELTGGALVAYNRLIHLCVFNLQLENNRHGNSIDTRLRRASLRRRRYH